MATRMLVVLTNPAEGREDDYNDWYTNTHLTDVLALEGFEAAQRFRFVSTEPAEGGPMPQYRYLALYEVPEDRMEAAQAALAHSRVERPEAEAAGRRPLVEMSEALHEERISWWVEPVAERRTAE